MRRCIALILALTATMGLLGGLSPAARADGDPASDVLLYDRVFDPADAGVSQLALARLNALLQVGDRAGYRLKVALVGSSSDLGTVTQLWENAVLYSQYLGQELSYVYHGNLLVVMPQTYGLRPSDVRHIPPGDQRAMGDLVPAGSDLAGGATLVVERLLRDNGVAIPARLALSLPHGAGTGGGSGPIIAIIVGALAVAGAWAASLRARPLRRRAAVPA